MKRIFFLLVLLGSLAKSYAGPIITFYEDFSLKIEGKKVYLVKKYYSNGNKIAITSYEKYLLPFDSKEAHIVMTGEEDENELIIANANDYYFVEYFRDYTKNMKQCVRAVKMFPTNSVTQTFRNNCFYVNGKWVRVAIEDGKLTPMPDFPQHPTVIAELEHTTLLKDKNFVYEYDNRTYTLKKIEGLNAKTVQFQKTKIYYKNLLYDDNAFYVMDYNGTDLMEITKDLRARGCNRKFTEATFIRYRSEGELYEQYLLDFKDGNLWSCDTYANYTFVQPIKNATYVKALEMVKTDHILFIASGAFQVARPSDLNPELQGRLPIRVELSALTAEDFERILTEPNASLTEQYKALMATEGVSIEFTQDAIKKIAEAAFRVNEKTENIGARRLHTVMERLMDKISFDASEMDGQTVNIDAAYVTDALGEVIENEDLSRFIL